MRVAIIGQAAFGEAVLRRLLDDGHEIAGVSAPAPAGGREDPLWAAASNAGSTTIATVDLREESGRERWAALAADICVMAFVTEMLPESLFDIPRLGTIQYHPSLLPLHRGSSAINWAIINQEAETGLTVFWPDAGMDTGPILLQRAVPIGPDDTVGSLYFDHLFGEGVDALAEAIQLAGNGEAPRVEQDHAASTYEPPCDASHGRIRWHEPAARIYAQIRGCNPQPGAWAMYRGTELKIFDCRLSETAEPGLPGRVLRAGPEGFDVRLNGGVLRILRVQPAGEKKLPAGEWASSVSLKQGSRFR